MTNNLKEDIEKVLVRLGYKCSVHDYLSEEGNKCVNESIENLLALINQKEKEARIDEVERVPSIGLLGSDGIRKDPNLFWKVDRIKQLKEELKVGKD